MLPIKGVAQDLRVLNPTQNPAKSHQSAFRDQIWGSESNLTVSKRQSRPNNSLSMVQEGAAAVELIKAYSSKQTIMEGITIRLLPKRWLKSSFRSLTKSILHRWTNIRTIRKVRESGHQTSHKARLNHLSAKVVKHSSNWIRSMNCQRVGEKHAINCSKFLRELRMQCALLLNAKLEHLLFNQPTSCASAITISNLSSRLVARSKGKW